MSNIYVSEPPTSGKVILETTVGDIEIELWSKEAPKTCRNFLQLCMEGYFDNTVFHRVVPGWIVQGGDPSGTGEGGESIYNAPFADEFHSRLRFSRRGLVGMANSGPNENRSQFFITLAPTPELQKKNTLFATVVGDSLYNALKLGEGEVDKETERPIYPRKIVNTRVLDSPFTDITTRTDGVDSVGANVPKARKKKMKAVKDKKLLSFADDEDDGDLVATAGNSTMKSSHDLLASDPALRDSSRKMTRRKDKHEGYREGASDTRHIIASALTDREDDADAVKANSPGAKEQEQEQEQEKGAQQHSARDHRRTGTDSNDTDGASKRSDTAQPVSNVASNVELMRSQYKSAHSASKRSKNDSREDELLARLGRFKSKIRKTREGEGQETST